MCATSRTSTTRSTRARPSAASPIRELTEGTYKNFKEDVAALGCLPPTVEPRATEHIEEMKTLIERLIASGNAYAAEDHVLFSVPSMPDYGKLSKRSLDEMVAGARVDVAPYKRGDMDFVLWKPSKDGEPGWPSPAGIKTPGRPGWHIECSAMSWKHLGETFDIHGGGIDLVFPHHENEIAQSRCAFHTPVMANVWMHNGFLQVEGEKMSKSLGNFITIREVLADWQGDVVRLAMLSTHYTPADQLDREGAGGGREGAGEFLRCGIRRRRGAPGAAACWKRLPTISIRRRRSPRCMRLRNAAGRKALAGTLAFFGFRPDAFAQWRDARAPALALPVEEIDRRIAARLSARKARDFAEADRIRDELAALGVVLKDSKDGTTWEMAR